MDEAKKIIMTWVREEHKRLDDYMELYVIGVYVVAVSSKHEVYSYACKNAIQAQSIVDGLTAK